MVQVSLAYIAVGVGVLLVLAGILALTAGLQDSMLSPHRRRVVLGGVAGMIVFLVVALVWLRQSVWLQ